VEKLESGKALTWSNGLIEDQPRLSKEKVEKPNLLRVRGFVRALSQFCISRMY
jgi:hypothetical protein